VGIGLSYRPAILCSLATQFQTQFLESIPRPIVGLKFPTQNPGINSVSLCSLAGRYDNNIPTRFLAPIKCLKISALTVHTCLYIKLQWILNLRNWPIGGET
jgi:hypothetical protein